MNEIILADLSMGFGVGMGVWFIAYWTARIFGFFKWFIS